MRKLLRFAVPAALAIVLSGCAKEFGIDAPGGASVRRTFTASFENGLTKTALSSGKVTWSKDDTIHCYTSGVDTAIVVAEAGPSAVFDVTTGPNDNWLNAVYGAKYVEGGQGYMLLRGVAPEEQDGTFPSAHVSVAHSDTLTSSKLSFKNVTSLIKFSLDRTDVAYAVFSSNDDSHIGGCGDAYVNYQDDGTISVSAGQMYNTSVRINFAEPGAGEFYISVLPCTLSQGFSLKCFSSEGVRIGVAKYTGNLVIPRNTITDLGTLDIEGHLGDEPTDLSAEETANCYIVPSLGDYKFKATVQGNSTDALTFNGAPAAPHDAVLLWYTRGTRYAPKVEVISLPEDALQDGYVYFTALNSGSAIVAVRDESGNILWSWHIWVWPGYSRLAATQEYYNGAGRMMDRNLGAAVQKGNGDNQTEWGDFGFFYQWGRKDPFTSDGTAAEGQFTPVSMPISEENGSIDYSIRYPYIFIYNTNNTTNRNWFLGTRDDTLWGSDKTKYDPCPPGWRVPDGNVWRVASNRPNSNSFSYDFDSSFNHPGMDFGGVFGDASSIWYPASGYRDGNVITYSTWYGFGWMNAVNGNNGVRVGVSQNKAAHVYNSGPRSHGHYVRCQAEYVIKPTPVSAVNILIPAEAEIEVACYKTVKLIAAVSPDEATNQALLWHSSDTEVAEVNEYGTVTAKKVGTCTITVCSAENPDLSDQRTITVIEDTTENLSLEGTANCYIVSRPGTYKFDASVKGNSNESVGTPASAKILWESYGTDTFDAYDPVIAGGSVSLDGGFVTFSIPSPMKDGNAVIAVSDASGTILWSWHIWACEGFNPVASSHDYKNNAGTVMDRNLGATSATPGDVRALGLLYQWGRKDPFLGPKAIKGSDQPAASATSSEWGYRGLSVTVAEAVKNPMVFYSTTSSPYNWNSEKDNTLWAHTKTKYDPCPLGWRVPDGGKEPGGLWATAIWGNPDPGNEPDTRTLDVSNLWNNTNLCGLSLQSLYMPAGYNGVVWYPDAAFRNGRNSGALEGYGQYGMYWSCTVDGTNANLQYHYNSNNYQPAGYHFRVNGCSVRCVKQN
ncbi:MAG: Ig-like domain-containing protein [Bacteroidales bacterium]|nr:Ig-like domain-containing protein [Bacteroidales bacterium]